MAMTLWIPTSYIHKAYIFTTILVGSPESCISRPLVVWLPHSSLSQTDSCFHRGYMNEVKRSKILEFVAADSE